MPVTGFIKAGLMSGDSLPLSGCGVLVTRPEIQSENLVRLVRKAGADAIAFPLIRIEHIEPRNTPVTADIVIVVSANAARAGHTYIKQLAGKVIAVGKATAAALQSHGIEPAATGEGDSTSESLLQADCLADVSGRKIIIVRGQGGRELLADALRERGAGVEYLEVYRRVPEQVDVKILYESMLGDRLDIISITSTGMLERLLEVCPQELLSKLKAVPLLVISKRIAAMADESGFGCVIVSRPGDENMLSALQNWWQQASKEKSRD